MKFCAVVFILVSTLVSCSKKEEVAAVQEKYQEGVHYSIIEGQPTPAKTGKIEVAEMFWYGCNHCYAFEFVLEPWKKTLAADVDFIGSPGMWMQRKGEKNAMWTHAKLYYTAKAMGELDKLHPMFFQAMHKDKLRLDKPKEIEAFVTAVGFNGKDFVEMMDTFIISAEVDKAEERLKTYKISGTPEMVVAGYYHLSSAQTGGQKGMLDVVDFLLNKIRSER